MQRDPAVVVLAAGSGSRFGGARHKLLQPLFDSTVLQRTLANALSSGLPVVVVTTAALVDTAVTAGVVPSNVVVLPVATASSGEPLGMGYSIARGVIAASHASGWVLLPGDMPLIRAETVRQVARGLLEHPVVYAQHQGRRGHPVAFAGELYSELVHLSGDEGARRIAARYPAYGVEVDDPSVLLDIDTPADLERLSKFRTPRQVFDDA